MHTTTTSEAATGTVVSGWTQGVERKAGTEVSIEVKRTGRSWTELRVEVANTTLDVVDAGETSVTLRVTARRRPGSAKYRDALNRLIAHGGSAHILDPNGPREDVRLA